MISISKQYLSRKAIGISDRKEKRQDSPIEETKVCSEYNQRGGGGWRCKQVHLKMQAGKLENASRYT